MARLLLADDHDLVLQTLAEFLQGTGVAQVSLASDVKTALALIAEFGPFDLALIDLHMSGMNGLAGFDAILSANQGRPVALISGGLSVDLARQALDAGAAGFVPKTLGAKALRAAVEAMLRGEVFAPIDLLPAHSEPEKVVLSPREDEVLRLLAQGQSNKTIAGALGLQEVTVKLHVATLHRKLGAKNRTQAATLARQRGLI
jgi:DNA-binding NarL/FixJ family response regulator